MESVFKYAIISLLVLPMLLMIVLKDTASHMVAIISALLVISTIPKRDRD